MDKENPRVCEKGHRYYKTSDYPTCPFCEAGRKPSNGFLSLLATPARRALEGEGINTLSQLSRCSEAEVLKLHGLGKSSLPKLRIALASENLSFRKQD